MQNQPITNEKLTERTTPPSNTIRQQQQQHHSIHPLLKPSLVCHTVFSFVSTIHKFIYQLECIIAKDFSYASSINSANCH